MQSKRQVPKLLFLFAALVGVSALALIGTDATVRSAITHFDQARLFADLESNRVRVAQDIETLSRDSITLTRGVVLATKRRVPTLEDLRGVAKGHRLQISRLERKAQTEAKADSRCDYVVSLSGNVRNAVDALHSLENDYRCRITRLAIQPASPSGDVVALSIQIQVQQ
jgi:hypothetical protein